MRILEKIKQEPTIFLFRKMWKFSKGNRGAVTVFIVLQTLANLMALTEPLIFAKFINEIQLNGVGNNNISFLLFLLSLFIVVALIFWLFHGTARIIERRNAFFVELNYKKFLLAGIFNLGLDWHSNRDSGDTIDKINKASKGLFQFSTVLFHFIKIFVQLIGVSIVLYIFSPPIGLGVFFMTIFFFFILLKFDQRLVPQYKELNLFGNKISAGIFDSISNITSVLILNVRSAVLKNINKLMWNPWKLWKKNVNLAETKWFVGDILFNLLLVVPIGFYVFNVYRNNLLVEVGTITALYMYLSRINRVFFTFAGLYESTMERKAAVQNAEDIENDFVKSGVRKKKITNWKELQIQNLNFSYEDAGSELHLDDVNVDITKGERIAFIGESGSGKTTFLKVLHGLYPTARASLLGANGQRAALTTSFADIDLKTMLVPQEPEIFSSTIRENITLGVNYPEAEIEKVIKLAEFTDTVKQLPYGLNSVINEKGVNLSGGQKQRLALARALLFAQDKELILLDESTSSVDPENEVRIYKNIFKHFKGKTVLASIHKMNLLKYFDRIVIFADGKVIDTGIFEELLKKNVEFAQSWKEYTKTHRT